MADWVVCKHPNYPDSEVIVNMDRIVRIVPMRGGAELFTTDQEDGFLVASTPAEILKGQRTRRA